MSRQFFLSFSRLASGRYGACSLPSSHTAGLHSRTFTRSFSRRTCLRKEELGRTRLNPLDQMAVRRKNEEEIAHLKRRMRFAGIGLAFSFLGVVVTTQLFPATPPTVQNDAPPNAPDFGSAGSTTTISPINNDIVATGTSTIPYFPRTITLPAHESTKTDALPSGTGDAESEFSLLGLGIRTVSIFGIQVYVVGIYVAVNDLAALQAAFVKEGASAESATTLIAGEKEDLRKRLLDHEEGEKIWERLLEKHDIRSVIRIVPTRNTDFGHLRDGFERNINARVRTRPDMAEDDRLGLAVSDFKAMLGKATLAKGEEVLLERGRQGELRAWYKGKKDEEWASLGKVEDERISRLLLLGYLAGKKVASEPCRQNVVDGIIHVVARPIGTAETEVI